MLLSDGQFTGPTVLDPLGVPELGVPVAYLLLSCVTECSSVAYLESSSVPLGALQYHWALSRATQQPIQRVNPQAEIPRKSKCVSSGATNAIN